MVDKTLLVCPVFDGSLLSRVCEQLTSYNTDHWSDFTKSTTVRVLLIFTAGEICKLSILLLQLRKLVTPLYSQPHRH